MTAAQNKKKVFVGLSGGVDSSVAALRLKRAGHDVTGVFIKTWHPDFLECTEAEDRLDAMRVAAHLDIPFLTFDASETYRQDVADYMIGEYREGRTPNPDVMCNKYVKFGAFLAFAKDHGADAVATGHYARIYTSQTSINLLRGTDRSKDQSYFLWTLTQEQLAHIMFPIGDTRKEHIRIEAAKAGLPTARKHDSQGICFLGEVDLKAFLSHYIDVESGDVLDESGKVIGRHDGALYYTLGQRHGFDITVPDIERTPHYVVSKDVERNTLTVAARPPQNIKDAIHLENVNHIQKRKDGAEYSAQFRYRQHPIRVRIASETVTPLEATDMPSAGQSCVIYDGDECLGGGIISAVACERGRRPKESPH